KMPVVAFVALFSYLVGPSGNRGKTVIAKQKLQVLLGGRRQARGGDVGNDGVSLGAPCRKLNRKEAQQDQHRGQFFHRSHCLLRKERQPKLPLFSVPSHERSEVDTSSQLNLPGRVQEVAVIDAVKRAEYGRKGRTRRRRGPCGIEIQAGSGGTASNRSCGRRYRSCGNTVAVVVGAHLVLLVGDIEEISD